MSSGPPLCPYSPKCVEGAFAELRVDGILGLVSVPGLNLYPGGIIPTLLIRSLGCGSAGFYPYRAGRVGFMGELLQYRVLASCVRLLRRVGYVAYVALGRSLRLGRRAKGKYGGDTRAVLQHLWTGVTSGGLVLLELRQTGPPRGARTHAGGRCSCAPAPTTIRASCSIQHQGDGGFGSGRGRVHAPNVTVGETSWDATLRSNCPHDGSRSLVYHQNVPERSRSRWPKAGGSGSTNGPLAVRCFAE